ncbi:MAG: hypothetical protein ACPG61_18250 [Paracoccaceae bacterium]
MTKLIRPDTIVFKAQISEEELKARLAEEVLEQIGALDANGQPALGVATKVLRGTGRKGGYTIEVTGPAPARLMLTKADQP